MKTLIIGATGSSAEVALMLTSRNLNVFQHEVEGFVDDDPRLGGSTVLGIKVLGSSKVIANYESFGFTSGIGSEKNFQLRLKILRPYKEILVPIKCISTTSSISFKSIIDEGVIVSQNCFVGSYSHLEEFVYMMPNSIIGHHSKISAGTIVCSGVTIAGGVQIGSACYIGVGVTIKNDIQISDGILIGSGSNVISDLTEKGVYVGNPARKIKDFS